MQANRLTVLAVIVAVALIALAGAGASTAMQAQPTAVAVADVQAIFNSLKEKTALEAELRSRGEQLQQQEQEKRNAIAQLRQDLGVLNAGSDAYRQKEEQLTEAAIALRVWAELEQQKLNRERVLQIESLYRQTMDAVAQVAQDSGYDVVLFKESAPEFDAENPQQLSTLIQVRKVLYAADSIDITSQVIQRMNNAYDAGR